jgi:hypothetical protein
MSSEIDFSDSTILWSLYAQNMMVTERTLNAIQAESPSELSAEHVVDTSRDHEDPALMTRRAIVEQRHATIASWLQENELFGLILSRPEHLAWIGAGAELSPGLQLWRNPIFVFVTAAHRMVVCDAVQSGRLFEEELFGLGFLHKEFPLDDGPQAILTNMVAGRAVAWDMRLDDRPSLKAALHSECRRLDSTERGALRRLGRAMALSVETTAATFKRGETERDVAAQLVYRMMREGIRPIHVQVLGGERARHFRCAGPKKLAINDWAVLSATGRKEGLEVSLSRCVSFGSPEISIIREFETAAMAQTTGAFFCRPGESVGTIAPKIRRIFEKNGFDDEWGRESILASAGRPSTELISVANVPSAATIPADSVWAWQTGIGQSRCCETIVTDDSGYECVTMAKHSRWPTIDIAVKGQPVKCTGYLKR